MSVINKMLRDLDNRQLGGSSKGASVLTAGTVALGAHQPALFARRSRGAGWRTGLVFFLVLAAVALAYGWWVMRPAATGSVSELVRVPLASGARQPTALAKPEVLAASAPGQPGNPSGLPQTNSSHTEASGNLLPPETAVSSNTALKETLEMASFKPLVKASAVSSRVAPVTPPATTPIASRLLPATAPSPVAVASRAQAVLLPAAPVVPVALAAAPKSSRQAAMEALAQAQAQWNEGSRLAAVELLNGAIVHLEQTPSADTATLAALAREFVRMTLAQGQPGEALATLERLEPRLSGVADIWALRGNAAQRLGRHPEAASAYLKGLALSPNEPRWMLGAAVSLAAQGQTGPAAELAEKARAAGALRPDVAHYLRQLGVVVRTD
jgi:tetratricopeptide (TPR) repeat protein